MRLAFALRYLLPLFLSVVMTSGAYFVDTRLSLNRRTQTGLALSRQIASQIEILTLNARQRNEPNPLNWATQILSIGTEPRLIQIASLEGPKTLNSEYEKFRLNSRNGTFSYMRVLDLQSGGGVKIQIHMGYLGFLGALAPWVSDLWILLFFGFVFSFLFKLIDDSSFKPTAANQAELDNLILQWTEDARQGLILLGMNMKQVILQAQKLASSTARARDHIEVGETQKALESFEDVFQITQNLNDHITKTSQSLLAEAKLIQELKIKVTGKDQKNTASTK